MTPFLTALVIAGTGALVYILAGDKFAEIGRAALWAGVFALAFLLCGLP